MGSITHEIHRMKNPHLPFIFRTTRVEAGGMLPNWHENIEIFFFLEGTGALSLDGRLYKVAAGDLGIVNADCLHATVGEPSLTYRYLIVDSGFCLENGIDVSRLSFEELVHDEALSASFGELGELYRRLSEGEEDPTIYPALRYCVLGILLRLLGQYVTEERKGATEEARGCARVKEIVRYLRDTSGPVSLDSLAREMGMSKFYMAREFKRITGTTVIAYLNRMRCEQARRMLREGAKVSEAAFAVGFDNLSYFSRTYKRYMGAPPSAEA